MPSATVKFPDIVKHSCTSFDFEETNKFNVQPIENPTNYTVQVNGEHKIFVPDDVRRACFKFGQLTFLYIMDWYTQLRFFVEKISVGPYWKIQSCKFFHNEFVPKRSLTNSKDLPLTASIYQQHILWSWFASTCTFMMADFILL